MLHFHICIKPYQHPRLEYVYIFTCTAPIPPIIFKSAITMHLLMYFPTDGC